MSTASIKKFVRPMGTKNEEGKDFGVFEAQRKARKDFTTCPQGYKDQAQSSSGVRAKTAGRLTSYDGQQGGKYIPTSRLQISQFSLPEVSLYRDGVPS